MYSSLFSLFDTRYIKRTESVRFDTESDNLMVFQSSRASRLILKECLVARESAQKAFFCFLNLNFFFIFVSVCLVLHFILVLFFFSIIKRTYIFHLHSADRQINCCIVEKTVQDEKRNNKEKKRERKKRKSVVMHIK